MSTTTIVSSSATILQESGRMVLTILSSNTAAGVLAEKTKQALDAIDSAADTAMFNAGMYPDTATGLINTTDGEYFTIPSPETDEFAILYLNSTGTAVEVKRVSSASQVQAAIDALELVSAEVAASAIAADASADAAAGSASAAATSANLADADRIAAQAARDAAYSAAQSSGVYIYDTKALANAAVAGLADLSIVEVLADESQGGACTRYRKESGVLAFKLSLEQFTAGGTGAVARPNQEKLRESVSVFDYLSLAERADALSGSPTLDLATSLQRAIDAAGTGGTVSFPRTVSNLYLVSVPLKFYSGQTWVGSGGVDVAGNATEIRLTATGTSVAEPNTPASVTYGFKAVGIYFNAQSFGDSGLSLYNSSYSSIDHCGASANKAGAAAILLDSNTSLRCYFNKINMPRVFATGAGGVGIRFTRGANANQVFGGKCGSSTRGMEFLSQSSGNLVVGTDFENNTDRHLYIDAPNNVFIGTHMESAPIGFDITALGTNTQRMNTTFATSTTINVQDTSKIGTTLDTRNDTTSTKGDLQFGPARFLSEYLSGVTRLDYDPDLVSGTSQALVRFFLRTNTSGNKQIILYRGDGTSNSTISMNAGTGEVYHGDLSMNTTPGGGGVVRKIIRRAAAPASGTWAQGDICFYTGPAAGGKIGAVCVTGGTPGTWKPFGAIDP